MGETLQTEIERWQKFLSTEIERNNLKFQEISDDFHLNTVTDDSVSMHRNIEIIL